MKHSSVIGIDTGGTCTDAVLIENGAVLATAKTPTTLLDPAAGVIRALEQVLADADPAAVSLVSVSTTLATNALVENSGADVGLFLIGHDRRMDIPAARTRFIPGGHKAKGVEAEPLGMEFLVRGIEEMKGTVDAYAVCAMLAFEDPTHELVAARAIELLDPRPIFCSHQASTQPGMWERASTAVLNARLLPVMRRFLHGIEHSMRSMGLRCPVCIVRGDTQAMSLEEALRHASATAASGPAATALFGAAAANGQTAIVVDVGGTTTDITLIRNGAPVIRKDGLTVGPWRTHVQAVEMRTVALGGDSLVRVESSGLTLGPGRVTPLCLACTAPSGTPSPEIWIGPELNAQCLRAVPGTDPGGDPILEWLTAGGPATPGTLRGKLRLAESALDCSIARLQAAGRIVVCGFTPTDALHVLDRLRLGDAGPSRRAAEILGKRANLTAEEFARRVLKQAHEIMAHAVLAAVADREAGPDLTRFLLHAGENPLLDIRIRLRPQVIGLGAAAPYLLPEAARILGAEAVFPEHYQVGNALGAALAASRQNF